MPKDKLKDLRHLLFETIERLLDDEHPLEPQAGHAVANAAKMMIETAKVELMFMKEVGALHSSFIGVEPNQLDDKITSKQLLEGE